MAFQEFDIWVWRSRGSKETNHTISAGLEMPRKSLIWNVQETAKIPLWLEENADSEKNNGRWGENKLSRAS